MDNFFSKRLLAPFIMMSCAIGVNSVSAESRFNDVWQQVKSDPYEVLPQHKVTLESFISVDFSKFPFFRDTLTERSIDTIKNDADLLPYFKKTLHANGVCLKGSWNITEATPYSGYFSSGSQGLIIARASTALSATQRHEERAFGLAGKIYPTNDEHHATALPTANFFTIENLGGIQRDYFLDAKNTNDIIQISPTMTVFMNTLVGARVAAAFMTGDQSGLATALIRELYPVAELDILEGEQTNEPVWLKIVGSESTPRILRDDFRDELNIENYPSGIMMDIMVATEGSRFGEKEWQKIGYILFDDTVASNSCDHRLHFHHPKSRIFRG